MKGKQTFTTLEFQRIEKLISEKVKATKNKQNTIKSKNSQDWFLLF